MSILSIFFLLRRGNALLRNEYIYCSDLNLSKLKLGKKKTNTLGSLQFDGSEYITWLDIELPISLISEIVRIDYKKNTWPQNYGVPLSYSRAGGVRLEPHMSIAFVS